MTKFLRKYNKWLIAGFGSFLVMTWLVSGPGAFQADPRKRVVATVGGEKLRATELGEAELEHRALEFYAPHVMAIAAGVTNGTHWYLLSREAQRAGFVGAAGDGANWSDELVELETELEIRSDPQMGRFADMILSQPSMVSQSQQNTRDRLARSAGPAAAQAQLQPQQFQQALAKLRGVVRMVSTFNSAPRLSDLRFIDRMQKALTRVSFDAISIPADRVPVVVEPSAEQLTKLFETYKNEKPGSGEFGFGYQLQRRVKAQWMILSKKAIEDAVVLDPIEVSKFWQQNRAKFPGEFATEKQNVETALQAERVEAALTEADRVVRSRIRSATRGLDVSAGVRVLPSDWAAKRPSLESIARSVVENVSAVKMPAPAVVRKDTDFTAIESFATLGEIGLAQYRVGTFSGTVEELLLQSYELSGTNALGLQVGVPFENFLTTPGGDRIYIVVTDARKESPAENLDQVREQVVRDAKLVAGYENLLAQREALRIRAVELGLEEVAKQFPATPASVTPLPLMVDRRVEMSGTATAQQYPQYDVQSLRDAVIRQLDTFGQSIKPTPENVTGRTLAVPLPASRSLAIVQITGWQPLSIESMRLSSTSAAINLASAELRETITDRDVQNPFGFENLKSRLQYISLEGGDARVAKDAAAKAAEKQEATPAAPSGEAPAAPAP